MIPILKMGPCIVRLFIAHLCTSHVHVAHSSSPALPGQILRIGITALGLSLVVLHSPAWAMGYGFYMPPELLLSEDMVGKNQQLTSLFLVNPAASIVKGTSFGFARSSLTGLQKGNVTGDTFSTDYRSDINQNLTYLGFGSALGNGFFLGFNAGLNEFKSENKNSNSRYARVPAVERQIDKDLQFKMAAEMTPGFWAGAVLRYSARKSDVLGSFSTDDGDRTATAGSLYGVGLGGAFKAQTAQVGLSYLMAKKGKVTVLGETKVTSDSGILIADGFLDATKDMRLGASWQLFFYDRDELRVETTSKVAQTRIVPKGIFYERELYPVQRATLSAEFPLFKKLSSRLWVGRETHLWVFGDDTEINKVTDDRNKQIIYRGRAGLVIQDSAVEAEIAFSYSKRSFKPFLYDGVTMTTQGEDKNLIIQLTSSL